MILITKFRNAVSQYSIVFFFLLVMFGGCKKGESVSEIPAIQLDKNLDVPAIITRILPIIFKDQLKEWSLSKDPSAGLWSLEISYGGSTALTFSSQSEYKDNILQTQALYLIQIVSATSELPMSKFKLSLLKPLYVKNEARADVGIQEFEIYRTLTEALPVKEILKKYPNTSPFADLKTKKAEVILILKEVNLIGKVELNQLERINVE